MEKNHKGGDTMNGIKYRTKGITVFILAFLLVLLFLFAGRTVTYADSTVSVDVDTQDFSTALQDALDQAGNEKLTVNVPKGEYTIDRNIYIYSNTVLNANGCTFNFNSTGTMLKGAHKHDGVRCRGDEDGDHSKCVGGYNQVKNVTVNGGTWNAYNGDNNNTQCIMFRHAQNITLKNITAKGNTNHAFNISGVNKATITNCTFTAPTKYTGTDKNFWGDIPAGKADRFNSMEAVHLDFTCASGEPNAWPIDNTPCKNITVSGCKFIGTFSGVGTHHANADTSKRAYNIMVKGCTFTTIASNKNNVNCYGRALTFYTANKVTFQNNTINGVYNAVLLDNVKNVVATNNRNVSGVKGNAFYVRNACSGKITNNGVNTPKQSGVYIQSSAVTAYNNTIKNAGTHGIIVENAKGAKVHSNTVTGSKKNGIMVLATAPKYTATAGVRYNTVKTSGQIGILVQDGTNCVVFKNTVTGSKSNGITVQGAKKICVGTKVKSNVSKGNKGKKDILINKKCKKTVVSNNKVGGAKRFYSFDR